MLISERVNKTINEQVGNEFGASLQYIAIASYFVTESLPELAAHFHRQAEEEQAHAMRFVKFIAEAGGKVVIPPIAAPKSHFRSVEEAVKLSLEQEKNTSKQINRLVELALKESDRATENFLQWFISEQFEEVSSMEKLLKMIQRAGESRLLYVETYLAGKGPSLGAASLSDKKSRS